MKVSTASEIGRERVDSDPVGTVMVQPKLTSLKLTRAPLSKTSTQFWKSVLSPYRSMLTAQAQVVPEIE